VLNPRARRRSRERALQFLFGLEFTQYAWEDVIDGFWDGCPVRPSVKSYAQKLICGVSEHREELDARIMAALDNWNPERIGRIEYTLLRIALYEMLYMEDVPMPVAIDEAIEIAKQYGAEEAPRFVNGVLDRLSKNLRETS